MKWSLSTWLARAVLAIWGVLTIGGLVLLTLTWGAPTSDLVDSGTSTVVGVLVECVFACVGLLLATKLPRNAIGWLFLAIAIALTMLFSLARYGVHALAHPGSLPGATVALSLAQSSWVVLVSSIALLLLLFPDGNLPSRRWRVVPALVVVGATATWVAFTTAPGPLQQPFAAFGNPLGVEALRNVDHVLAWGWLPMISGVLAGAGSLVYRYRRAEGIERRQIELFTYAAVAFPLVTMAANLSVSTSAANVLAGVTALLLPVATAIAILRYRLFDFDRVISRTIAYAVLTAVLVAAYAGLVLVGQFVFSSFAGGSKLAVAVSTLVVAALFLPLRARIQRIVDSRFNRSRYDARRTLEAFGARLREHVELDTLSTDLGLVVQETIQPSHVSLWLRSPK